MSSHSHVHSYSGSEHSPQQSHGHLSSQPLYPPYYQQQPQPQQQHSLGHRPSPLQQPQSIPLQPSPAATVASSLTGLASAAALAASHSHAQQQQQQKSRSVMACVLCRKQKMKCEGPDKAPCKRCRTAGVECTFEAPPAAAPRARGGGASEAYVEARFSQVEERLSSLESTPPPSALVPSSSSTVGVNSALSLRNGALVTDHERRIAALEAQIYALQLSASALAQQHQHQPPQQQQQQLYRPPPPQQPTQPQYAPQSFSHYSGASAGPVTPGINTHQYSGSFAPSTTNHKAYFDGPCSFANGEAFRQRWPSEPVEGVDFYATGQGQEQAYGQGGAGQRGEKRIKLDEDGFAGQMKGNGAGEGEGDFIDRGVITEKEASMCFESYFLTFARPTTTVPAPTSDPSTSPPAQSHSSAIHLPFAQTRTRSPLLLATIISIGARSLARFDTYQATLREAIRLCHGTFLSSEEGGAVALPTLSSSMAWGGAGGARAVGAGAAAGDRDKAEPTSVDLKGIMLLSLYNGMPDLMSHGIALSWRFGTPTALGEWEDLVGSAAGAEVRKGRRARALVRRGRTFLVAFLWTSFYSYCRGLHGSYHIPSAVIRKQLDLLEASGFSQQPSDRGIRVNVEECLILRDVFDKLGPGMRLAKPKYEELCSIVEQGLEELEVWNRKWRDMMEMITQWGDSRELKTAVPLHHGRMCLLMYIFRDMVVDDRARAYPKMREFAKMGSESALVILRWGVESRIWLPHSMVAQYLHHVNIPTAITLLYTTTRLFPTDAPLLLIRRLLHRLLKQCDSCINGNAGTAHEVRRATETKRLVVEFDRFVFDQAAPGAGGDSGGEGEGEEGGLFGEEITASIEGMRLEMSLWGSILEGALED